MVDAKTSSHWPITVTNGLAALFCVGLPMALARILSPEQIGEYNIFFLYLMVIQSVMLVGGLNNGLYHWTGHYPQALGEVRESWTLLLAITLAACAAGLIFADDLSAMTRIPRLDFQILLLSTPFYFAAHFMEDLMIARGDIWRGSWFSSGFQVLRVGCLLAAAWWTRNVTAVYVTFALVALVRLATGGALLWGGGELKPLFSISKLKNVAHYALPVSVAGGAAMALHYVDQVVLSFRLDPVHFAIYAMGCLSIPPLQILETSVNRVLIPRLAKAFADDDGAQAIALFRSAVLELFRFMLPATLGLIVYARPIVRVLFTDRYVDAAFFLRLYALTYLFTAVPFDALARARGHGGWILRTSLLLAAISVAATWTATGYWGATGALLAVLVSQLGLRLYSLLYSQQALHASPLIFLPLRAMARDTLMALVGAIVSVVSRPIFTDDRMWFFCTGPLFTLIYFGGIYFQALWEFSRSHGPIGILELAQSLEFGGLERTVYSLAHSLNRQDRFKVSVVTYNQPADKPSLAPQFAANGIPVIQWQKGEGFSVLNVIRLIRIVLLRQTRIMHVHDLGPLIYGGLAKIFMLGRIRLVVTLHALLNLGHHRRYPFYYRFFLKFADRIIAVSPGIKAGLVDLGVPSGRIEVIPNGAQFFPPANQSGDPADKRQLRHVLLPGQNASLYACRWLLSLARLHAGKGQDVVLDIWAALAKEVRKDLALFFVGPETLPGYQQLLRQKIEHLPDRDRIWIVGGSDRPEDWIRASDLFISGSLYEGMPLAPLEAAGSGLPTLLSEIEGHLFLKPWAQYFDLQKPADGAAKVADIIQALNTQGDSHVFDRHWESATPLRERWGTSAMTAGYTEAFESA